MVTLAVTGPSSLSSAEAFAAREFFRREIPSAGGERVYLRTGGARGTDTIAAEVGRQKGAYVVLVAPAADYNQAVDALAWEIVRVPPGKDRAESYMARNAELLNGAGRLLAVLRQPSFYRSGEWATVNRAVKRGILVERLILA